MLYYEYKYIKYILFEDDDLLKKCNIIWYKFSTDTEK